ncbi:MAG: hypothetical protein MK108_15080 [Mariniblastus sp.]|nr:hypothetical protein [Mariniblastus sp.]
MLSLILICVLLPFSLIWVTSPAGATPQQAVQDDDSWRFDGIGPHTRAIQTESPQVQAMFNQALTWAYGFNHDEAINSLMAAAKLDPDCPMIWWAIAYCEGPNYNLPITPERSKAAWYALQNALARRANGSEREQDLIEALATRYRLPAPEDRAELDQAYADAMRRVWQKYPQDADIGTLYAESMMMLRPWELYTTDGSPEEGTDQIVETLEAVLKLQKDHPGANHLYVHAMEPSLTPGRALPAANALDNLVPVSGHLLHMPSHIYVRTGHWEKAVEQNQKALQADDRYLARSPNQTMQHLYMIHNTHMLAYAAMMSGREKTAMQAARRMWEQATPEVLAGMGPYLDRWMVSVYDVQKRFGRWDALLAEPAPPASLLVTTAVWRAHRAVAYAAKKDFPQAEKEYTAFRQAREAISADYLKTGGMTDRFLEVSDLFIRGEIALQQQEWDKAIEYLQQAAEIESTLAYGEPPQWLQPVRHTLGAVYLASGDNAAAERCYREDLETWPGNGWSLYGLQQALLRQNKADEAQQIGQQFQRSWKRADAPIDSSCKCLSE